MIPSAGDNVSGANALQRGATAKRDQHFEPKKDGNYEYKDVFRKTTQGKHALLRGITEPFTSLNRMASPGEKSKSEFSQLGEILKAVSSIIEELPKGQELTKPSMERLAALKQIYSEIEGKISSRPSTPASVMTVAELSVKSGLDIKPHVSTESAPILQVDEQNSSPEVLQVKDPSKIGGGQKIAFGDEIYTFGERLGKGAFSIVFKAEDSNGKPIALKVLHKSHPDYDKSQIIREHDIQAKLTHSGIIGVGKMAQTEDLVFLRMDYVEGQDLEKFIEAQLDSDDLPELMNQDLFATLKDQIIGSIQHCHENGIFHRDLKLQNFMLTGKMETKLADFGFASLLSQNGQVDMADEAPKHGLMGSHLYLAPDSRIMADKLGGITDGAVVKADAFALGVILLQLLSFGLDGMTKVDENDDEATDSMRMEATLYHKDFAEDFAATLSADQDSWAKKTLEELIIPLLHEDPFKRIAVTDIPLGTV